MGFIERLARHNGQFIAKALRELASWFEHLLPGPAVLATPVMFSTGGVRAMGEVTVTEGDPPISATVGYVNASTGKPASAADTPVWSSADESIASVEASSDGLSATVTPVSSGDADGGTAVVISVVAHDADGDEVRSEGTITVRPDEVLIGEITFETAVEGAEPVEGAGPPPVEATGEEPVTSE